MNKFYNLEAWAFIKRQTSFDPFQGYWRGKGRDRNKCALGRPTCVGKSLIKFGWILSIGLGDTWVKVQKFGNPEL